MDRQDILGEAHAGSDTDIMIEIDPAAPVGVYEYVRLKSKNTLPACLKAASMSWIGRD